MTLLGRSRAAVVRQLGRARPEMARRGVAIVIALLLELLLLLLLLGLGRQDPPVPPSSLTVVDFAAAPSVSEEPTPPEVSPQQPEVESEKPTPPTIDLPPTAPPVPPLPDTPELASFDLSQIRSPRAPPSGATSGPLVGPPNRRASNDSARVGTAPNGEPLYAAAWYREPYEDELRGYLSTASGPGWGMIVCRTAPDFRVEDCVALEESPRGSNINRSLLAAAWQFKVRPPRLGGRSMVGAWVRIRLDYSATQRP